VVASASFLLSGYYAIQTVEAIPGEVAHVATTISSKAYGAVKDQVEKQIIGKIPDVGGVKDNLENDLKSKTHGVFGKPEPTPEKSTPKKSPVKTKTTPEVLAPKPENRLMHGVKILAGNETIPLTTKEFSNNLVRTGETAALWGGSLATWLVLRRGKRKNEIEELREDIGELREVLRNLYGESDDNPEGDQLTEQGYLE
jgi:hypothetical protein